MILTWLGNRFELQAMYNEWQVPPPPQRRQVVIKVQWIILIVVGLQLRALGRQIEGGSSCSMHLHARLQPKPEDNGTWPGDHYLRTLRPPSLDLCTTGASRYV